MIQKFRSGVYNVLVATCIAEEGLDIGQVDLVVNFDTLTSPVRMVQRMGRTGRRSVGRIVMLMSEAERRKWLASKRKTAAMYRMLKQTTCVTA